MCMCNILQQVARVSGSKQVRQHVRVALYYVNTRLKHAGGKDCPSFSNYVFHKLCYDTVNEHGKVGGVDKRFVLLSWGAFGHVAISEGDASLYK